MWGSKMKTKFIEPSKKAIAEIWNDKNDHLNSWIDVTWLVKKQIEEIEQKNYEATTFLNEMADILIIIIRYLDKINIDPKKLIFHRLKTRHKNKTEEIAKKYEKIREAEIK